MSAYTNVTRRIILDETKVGKRIVNEIKIKQDGACRDCKTVFLPSEQVISCGKPRKYYHIHCAEKLGIVIGI